MNRFLGWQNLGLKWAAGTLSSFLGFFSVDLASVEIYMRILCAFGGFAVSIVTVISIVRTMRKKT